MPKFLQAKHNAASLSKFYSSQLNRLNQLALKDLVFLLEKLVLIGNLWSFGCDGSIPNS
jgi:hypothetical protein